MVKGSVAEPLKRGRHLLGRYFYNYADSTGKEMVEEIRERTPVDTGDLKASIHQIPVTREGRAVAATTVLERKWRSGARSNMERASFTEYPTAPHIIRAKPGRKLRFYSFRLDKVVQFDEVRHPGTDGHFMFLRGSKVVESRLVGKGNLMLERWKKSSGL